ncbi:hypothetical protein P175DRAFT_0435431 [Aspergillus ochraceoroseus IBT 24754]|uniref:LEA domain protein n=2 Tax=Aspergillus ochraceoroseus TaxID=138278 RepID=A0A2T5LYQ8_9EURO|nr:uncharacterized protein P175DRAFT_0435431 [Aspergillus ochraceoroseus IBT 24754]KKK12067.1 hypothetical protein AOCH_003754 [Aspergillus ochraceoroseus]PTU21402.1 hypothetical protein P175DRAFT_0435431 [Aspergillus ochraceoroseus IBT 24754]
MSFLTRCAPSVRALALMNPAAGVCKTTTATTPVLAIGGSYRSISSTRKRETGPVDAAKSTLKKADRLVSDAAVKGIETGESAAHKVKETVGVAGSQAKEKSAELKGAAAEMAGKGKGKAQETLSEVKGKAKEAADNVKS